MAEPMPVPNLVWCPLTNDILDAIVKDLYQSAGKKQPYNLPLVAGRVLEYAVQDILGGYYGIEAFNSLNNSPERHEIIRDGISIIQSIPAETARGDKGGTIVDAATRKAVLFVEKIGIEKKRGAFIEVKRVGSQKITLKYAKYQAYGLINIQKENDHLSVVAYITTSDTVIDEGVFLFGQTQGVRVLHFTTSYAVLSGTPNKYFLKIDPNPRIMDDGIFNFSKSPADQIEGEIPIFLPFPPKTEAEKAAQDNKTFVEDQDVLLEKPFLGSLDTLTCDKKKDAYLEDEFAKHKNGIIEEKINEATLPLELKDKDSLQKELVKETVDLIEIIRLRIDYQISVALRQISDFLISELERKIRELTAITFWDVIFLVTAFIGPVRLVQSLLILLPQRLVIKIAKTIETIERAYEKIELAISTVQYIAVVKEVMSLPVANFSSQDMEAVNRLESVKGDKEKADTEINKISDALKTGEQSKDGKIEGLYKAFTAPINKYFDSFKKNVIDEINYLDEKFKKQAQTVQDVQWYNFLKNRKVALRALADQLELNRDTYKPVLGKEGIDLVPLYFNMGITSLYGGISIEDFQTRDSTVIQPKLVNIGTMVGNMSSDSVNELFKSIFLPKMPSTYFKNEKIKEILKLVDEQMQIYLLAMPGGYNRFTFDLEELYITQIYPDTRQQEKKSRIIEFHLKQFDDINVNEVYDRNFIPEKRKPSKYYLGGGTVVSDVQRERQTKKAILIFFIVLWNVLPPTVKIA